MAYVKKIWKDYPDTTTQIKAEDLNNIEDGIEALDIVLNNRCGIIEIWGANNPPTGYLLCDGSAISRTTYSDLFGVIGTTYGTGDGSTTFNLPNLKGRVPAGRDSSQTEFDILGETGGEKTHTLTIPEMPSHYHGTTPGGTISTTDQVSGGGVINTQNTGRTGSTGGDGAHNNLQPYIVLNYIIKY